MLPDSELRVTDEVFSIPLCPGGTPHKVLFFTEIGEQIELLDQIGTSGSLTTSPCPGCHFLLKVDFHVSDNNTMGWKSLSPIVELIINE